MRFVQTPRLSRSATFRFALVYALLFSLTVLLLFGGFYWSTAALIERQVADTVAAELCKFFPCPVLCRSFEEN